jgi:hypothetical protein
MSWKRAAGWRSIGHKAGARPHTNGEFEMRDAAIVEIGIREIATYCEFADFAYSKFDGSETQETALTFFHIHAFLGLCGTVARLVWSEEFAPHASGRSIAQVLDVPADYRSHQDGVRELIDHYDRRLAQGLALRGEVGKILDRNVGDRDAFEEEFSIFLHHYDPTVHVLTELEEEIDLQRLHNEIADTRARATAWLAANAVLEDRPAEVVLPSGERSQ